jgi:hypothetical protein
MGFAEFPVVNTKQLATLFTTVMWTMRMRSIMKLYI